MPIALMQLTSKFARTTRLAVLGFLCEYYNDVNDVVDVDMFSRTLRGQAH